MPVQHVEIHQIHKNQAAGPRLQRLPQFRHAIRIIFRRYVIIHAARIVNIVNLSDAEHRHLLFRQHVQQHGPRRFHRIVMPPLGSFVITARSAKRPRNHPPHPIRPVQQFPRDLAHAIQLRHRNHVFMCRNLKHAVARRVHNRKPSPHVFVAQFLQNLRSRGRLVPQRPPPNLVLKFRDQRLRKSAGIHRKRLVQPDPRHLPVPRRRVLPWRTRRALAIRPQSLRGRRQIFQRFDIREAQPHQIRNLQRPRPRNMPQRVSPHVAVFRRIGQFPNPHAVQHDPDDPLKILDRFAHAHLASKAGNQPDCTATEKSRPFWPICSPPHSEV